ncbi:TraR/DksA C4-type zinc finger protein [Nocardia nova]|uniref:TraR/DksA family transcriptional regulator n=1 Tax=Nocardia nova TaxID=37330 RepID=UPI001C45BFFF|nr:TraR/DksA C4-type zinc finger protein [Nocardia nova]MBV7701583.1 TraR/DksA C4-type zinc finger protein [Nocardia nova]
MTHAPSRTRLTDHLPALRTALNQQRRFRVQQLTELDAELARAPLSATADDNARHEVTVTLAVAARRALTDIDDALALITAGRYGHCRACHTEIPIHLLQTIPTTQWCLNCQQELPARDDYRPTRTQLFRRHSPASRNDHSVHRRNPASTRPPARVQ